MWRRLVVGHSLELEFWAEIGRKGGKTVYCATCSKGLDRI